MHSEVWKGITCVFPNRHDATKGQHSARNKRTTHTATRDTRMPQERGCGSYLQQQCIMPRKGKWLAYLFSGGAFLGREGGFLEYHTALDVAQSEGLRVGMYVVALRVLLGLCGEHGALLGLLHRVGVVGAVQRAHVGDCVLFDEGCEVTRHSVRDVRLRCDVMRYALCKCGDEAARGKTEKSRRLIWLGTEDPMGAQGCTGEL